MHKAAAPESVALSKQDLNASAKRIAEEDWVGKAVRSANDRQTAIIAASTAASSSGPG